VCGRVQTHHGRLRDDAAVAQDLRCLRHKWHERELGRRGRVGLMIEKDRFNVGVAGDDVIVNGGRVKHWRLARLLPEPAPRLAVTRRLAVVPCLEPQRHTVATLVPTRLKPRPASAQRQTVAGLGTMLAQTIVWASMPRRAVVCSGPTAARGSGQARATSKPAIRLWPGPPWQRPRWLSASARRGRGFSTGNRRNTL
jgi:hypothetical protein